VDQGEDAACSEWAKFTWCLICFVLLPPPCVSPCAPSLQLYGIVTDTMLVGAAESALSSPRRPISTRVTSLSSPLRPISSRVPSAGAAERPVSPPTTVAVAATPAAVESAATSTGCPVRQGPPPRALFSNSDVEFEKQDAFELNAPSPAQSGACPYLHGTVDTNPYPGYIHGKHPEICPNACVPVVDARVGETPTDTLLREAREYCDLYHAEHKLGVAAATQRWTAIEESILATGTYDLTFDELQHGARVAWRNAPKCSNRSKWAELSVFDFRHISSNAAMFKGILKMLGSSIESGATTTSMAVFRARLPGEKQGPRIWNGSLYRFAGYEYGDAAGTGVLGEPADAAFTTMLMNKFGWEPPSPRSRWDVLPLLLQIDENAPPDLFPIPSSFVPIVPIQHPHLRQLDALELRWFGVPVVSGLEISIGGLAFTAAPFAGWFADTEIVRDLTDECRYNVLPDVADGECAPIACAIYLDATGSSSLLIISRYL
jgi:nitric oxide synthase oxygenase domain/subunit